jgi:hypothetical protein
MGHELFDYAFKKTHANRWKFLKHPTQKISLELWKITAVDLDWFWRGWFYSTDYARYRN